jgi:HD-GYP domain-containing protein (c-di-GMP phosphodiesterase class II)
LKGDEIPTQARIVSVADTFDAMTTDRPYQKGLDLETALTRLKGLVGTRYDARVVAAFIAACEAGKIRPGVTRLKRKQSDYVGTSIPAVPITPPSDSIAVN